MNLRRQKKNNNNNKFIDFPKQMFSGVLVDGRLSICIGPKMSPASVPPLSPDGGRKCTHAACEPEHVSRYFGVAKSSGCAAVFKPQLRTTCLPVCLRQWAVVVGRRP
jgi:hypothetical protein